MLFLEWLGAYEFYDYHDSTNEVDDFFKFF